MARSGRASPQGGHLPPAKGRMHGGMGCAQRPPTPHLHQLCTQLLPCPGTAQEAAPPPVTRRSWYVLRVCPPGWERRQGQSSPPAFTPWALLGLRDHLQPKTPPRSPGSFTHPTRSVGPKPSRCASILYPASTLILRPHSPDSAPSGTWGPV